MEFKFGDLNAHHRCTSAKFKLASLSLIILKHSPIRQIKTLAKVSRYTVHYLYLPLILSLHVHAGNVHSCTSFRSTPLYKNQNKIESDEDRSDSEDVDTLQTGIAM